MLKLKSLVNRLRTNSFVKSILTFFTGTFIALIFSVILQFILPKVLSQNEFGQFKSFTLYLGYLSLLHFGLKDGIYVRLCEISNSEDLNTKNRLYYSALVYQQLIISILGIVGSLLIGGENKNFFLLLSVASLFSILITYFESYYQAIKEFKVVSILKGLREGFILILLISAIIFNINIDINLLLIFLLIKLGLACLIFIILSKKSISFLRPQEVQANKSLLIPIYKRGFGLLAGNFGHQLNTNIDKLFISFFFSNSQFAIYSFGGIFFVLSNNIITSFSTVLLPFLYKDFSTDLRMRYIQFTKTISLSLVIFAPYLTSIFFLVKYIYPEYASSIPIIAWFSFGMMYNITITVLHNNYFKVLMLDKLYVAINYLFIVAFILLLGLFLYLEIGLIGFAILTSSVMFLRYVVSEFFLRRNLKAGIKDFLILNVFVIAIGTLMVVIAKFIS